MTTEAQKKARKKYRESGKRLTVDFYPTETELFAHVDKQPNKQGYIKDLIRADMEKQVTLGYARVATAEQITEK